MASTNKSEKGNSIQTPSSFKHCGVSPILPKQMHNRQRSTEPNFSMMNLDQANYQSQDHNKFIDKVYETIKFQINQFNSVCNHQHNFQALKYPQLPFKVRYLLLLTSMIQNIKEGLRYTLGFNSKIIAKITDLNLEIKNLKDRDFKAKRIQELESKIEEYSILFNEIHDNNIVGIDNNRIEEIQKNLQERQVQIDQEKRDLMQNLECQAKICSELLRESENIKTENNTNKSLLQQTQAQLKYYINLTTTEQNQLEDTNEIGKMRFDTQNNEIEQVVLIQSQNQLQLKCESPLTKALFANETINHQNEMQQLKMKLEDYQQNYIKKDYLIQLIDKLHDTLINVEIDASSLKDLISNVSYQLSKDEDMSNTTIQNAIAEQLNINMQNLQMKLKNALGSTNKSSSQQQNEILDLKTEMCSLKNKLLQSEQRRVEEINAKNMVMSQLEIQLNQEQRRRIEEMDEKERKIEELERDIEHTIEGQMQENQDLRNKVSSLEIKLNMINSLENEIKSVMGIQQKDTEMTQMIQKLLNDNKNLKETCKSNQMTIEELRYEHSSRYSDKEEKHRRQVIEIDEKYKQIIIELQNSLESQIKSKDTELHNLKLKMSEQLDNIQQSLDGYLNQNQELQNNLSFVKYELSEKDIKQQKLIDKLQRLRDERNKLKLRQELTTMNLNDILTYVSQIEQQLNIRNRHFKVLLKEKHVASENQEEVLNKIQDQKDSLKQVLDQLIQMNVNRKSRDQGCQVNIQLQEKPQQDHYSEILKLLKQSQQNDKDERSKNEFMLILSTKLEDLQKAIDKQSNKSPRCNRNLEQIHYSKQSQQKTATPKPIKSQSLISNLDGRQQNLISFSTKEFEEDIQQNQQEGCQNQEEQSKFWHEMYQRIKNEIQKEKQITSQYQNQLQDKEEELYQMKQQIYLLKSENETLEQLNSQYLQQCQEAKNNHLVVQKTSQLKQQELTQLIDYIIETLSSQTKQLKGEYLITVINKIESYKGNENSIQLIIEELMIMFKTLMKQLQITQKELGQVQKENQELQYSRRSPLKQRNNDENLVNSQASTTYYRPQFKGNSLSQNRENVSSSMNKNQQPISNVGRQSFDNMIPPQTDRSTTSRATSSHVKEQINMIPKQSHRQSLKQQVPNQQIKNDQNSTQSSFINLPLHRSNSNQCPTFKYVPGQQLTERQRLELYELRTAALREIEECESRSKEADPYLKKYVKSIDELLRKAIVNN